MNTYCIDCNARMCQQCISFRKSKNCLEQHKHLQIRRYVYQNVVNIPDIQRFFDSSKIQQFTVNGAKVVHLNPKAKINGKGVNGGKEGNYRACEICKRNISEPNRFCCLACKVLFRNFDQNIRVHLQECASNITSTPSSLPSPELNAVMEIPTEKTQQEPCAVVTYRHRFRRNNRRKSSPKRSPFF